MREILFRGKQEHKNKEWVFGNLHCEYGETDKNGQRKIDYRILGMRGECDYVLSETVGQFTGLTDKNGKKIFEWDVLQFNYTGKNHGVEGKATVIFEHGKFGVLWGWHKEFVCLDGFANTTIEVIGNIHDNPELLENP